MAAGDNLNNAQASNDNTQAVYIKTTVGGESTAFSFDSSTGVATGSVLVSSALKFAYKVETTNNVGDPYTVAPFSGGAYVTGTPVAKTCGYQNTAGTALAFSFSNTHGGSYKFWTAGSSGSTQIMYTNLVTVTDIAVCASAFTGSDVKATTPANTANTPAGSSITYTCNTGFNPAVAKVWCSNGTWETIALPCVAPTPAPSTNSAAARSVMVSVLGAALLLV